MTDHEIWAKFKNGDEKAFAHIFDTYHIHLYEYGQRFSSDESLLKDSIQDVFLELARKKDKLSDTDNILFYLLKSIRLKIFNNLKKQKSQNVEVDLDNIDSFRLNYSLDVNTEEQNLKLDLLADAINKLPPRQKETIYLKFYKNLSNAEVAEIMQLNYQSVSNSIQKAIQKLKVILQADSDSIILYFQTYIC